jgi:hypothetical protein
VAWTSLRIRQPEKPLSREGFEGSEGSEKARNGWSGKESLALRTIGNPSETILQVNFINIDEESDLKRNKLIFRITPDLANHGLPMSLHSVTRITTDTETIQRAKTS